MLFRSDQGATVEHEATCPVPPDQLIRAPGGALHEELPQLVMAVKHAAGLIEDAGHQRALESRIGEIQIDESFDVVRPSAPIPLVVDELSVRRGCRIGRAGHNRHHSPIEPRDEAGVRD